MLVGKWIIAGRLTMATLILMSIRSIGCARAASRALRAAKRPAKLRKSIQDGLCKKEYAGCAQAMRSHSEVASAAMVRRRSRLVDRDARKRAPERAMLRKMRGERRSFKQCPFRSLRPSPHSRRVGPSVIPAKASSPAFSESSTLRGRRGRPAERHRGRPSRKPARLRTRQTVVGWWAIPRAEFYKLFTTGIANLGGGTRARLFVAFQALSRALRQATPTTS